MNTGGILVTQPIMQRRRNQTELRSMDSSIQISSRFQKSKFLHRHYPILKSPFTSPKGEKKNHPLGGYWVIFLVQGSDGG